jgi:hypothetical protein
MFESTAQGIEPLSWIGDVRIIGMAVSFSYPSFLLISFVVGSCTLFR